MLKHLIVYPSYGLCNRFRALAAAMRVVEYYKAKLTIVFPRGDFRRLVQLPNEVEVLRKVPDLEGYTTFSINQKNKGLFDFSTVEYAYFQGGVPFDEVHLPGFEISCLPRYIKPSELIREKVKELKERLKLPGKYIGMHIRRGDHAICKKRVPDHLFVDEIRRIVDQHADVTIAIACEDIRLRDLIKRAFPDQIIIVTSKNEHWNQQINMQVALDDYAELLVMADAEYVIGTEHSSYSRMIIACNGNPASFLMGAG